MVRYTIEQARKLAGLTQLEMAERLGMSEATYIKYEKGNIIFRMDVADKFADNVKLPISNIIFFDKKVRKIRTKEAANEI